MSDAIPLPSRPSLEQYKKLAKEFQEACRSSESHAIRGWAVRWMERLKPQTQEEIGREAEAIERRWNKLKKSNASTSRCTLADAQFFLAREHGFTSWTKFAKHVQALTRANSPVLNFEAAADAIVSGDVATLQELLRSHPELVRERSTRDHRSTLLHYVSANGIEDFRQKTPKNIVEITKLLLDAGADVNAESDAYGGGCTTLGLVATSVHPEQAGVQIALLQTLLDRGAAINHPSAAGNRQSIVNGCLANGQPKAAEFLAKLGARVDLEAAAGLGWVDTVKGYLDESGLPSSRAGREQLESGFEYACWYGRKEVIEFLLETDIHPDMRSADGRTGLHRAAYGAHLDVIQLLLGRGARIDLKDDEYHATPLDVALWVWDNSRDAAKRERCYEVIALLARAGAKLDPQQWRNSDSGRPSILEKIRSDSRMQAALRGEPPA